MNEAEAWRLYRSTQRELKRAERDLKRAEQDLVEFAQAMRVLLEPKTAKRGRPAVSDALKLEALAVFDAAPKFEGMRALKLAYPHLSESTLRHYLTEARRILGG